ncbi:MAG: hypothetical protein KBT36_13340 [Kurthia sp.]|nr:hypothetical protein [Candidatus Kurthia equi]
MKHKKQEAFAYELLIPLFFGMLALISSIGLLFLIAPHKQFYVDAPLMLSFTIASNLLVSFALLKVIHTINTPKNTVAFGFKILVLAIPLLLSLATASSALFNDSKVLERLATVTIVGYIFFTSIFICSHAIKFLLAGSPSKLDLIQMLADLQAFEGIVFVNNLQAWTIASHLFGVKCEIVVVHNGQHPQQIVDQVTDYILQKYNIEHIIFDVTNQHLGDYYDV